MEKRKALLLREKRRLGLEEIISPKEEQELLTNKPIQKIIRFIDFDDLKIFINRNVLIPRYETQEVILKALEFIKPNNDVLDLCTGSGYIGLTIKQKVPSANVTMSDIDIEAIKQAKENAVYHNLDVSVVQSDLFNNIQGKFNVIVSNPPYVPSTNKLDSSVLEYEPSTALFAGKDGNDFYRQIISQAPKYLKGNGVLIFEISPDNVSFLKKEDFTLLKDINNKERIAYKIFK